MYQQTHNNYYCHKEGNKKIFMTALYCKTVGNHEMFFVIKYLHLHSSLMEVLSSISKETPMERIST